MCRPWNIGFSLAPGLLVFASMSARIDRLCVLRFVAITLCVHGFGYILNDVCDADSDRTDPRRSTRPLTSGIVTRGPAVFTGVSAVAAATVVLGSGFSVRISEWTLLAGVLCLAITYNLFSKRAVVPVVTNMVLGCAFAGMPLLASQISGGVLTAFSMACAAYQLLFMMFVNAAYGSVRDLDHESRLNIVTTARYMRSESRDGQLLLSQPLLVYIVVLQLTLAMTALYIRRVAVTSLKQPDGGRSTSWGVVCVICLIALSSWSLWKAFRHYRSDGRVASAYATLHMLSAFLSPTAALLGVLPASRLIGVAVGAVGPLCFHSWFAKAIVLVGSSVVGSPRAIARRGAS